jgi:hypothetical protein
MVAHSSIFCFKRNQYFSTPLLVFYLLGTLKGGDFDMKPSIETNIFKIIAINLDNRAEHFLIFDRLHKIL